MKTLFRNDVVLVSSLILFLFPLMFSSLVSGEMLHPSDNASVSDDVLKRRWPNGVIPYTVVLDSGTTYRTHISRFILVTVTAKLRC